MWVYNVIAEKYYFGNSGNSCLNLQSSSSLSVDAMSCKHAQFSVKNKVCFLVCFSPRQFKVQYRPYIHGAQTQKRIKKDF